MTSFNPKDLLPKSSTASTSSKRSGVGSKTQQNDNISEDWTKFGKRQILSIGNNKKRHNEQVDIEEDDIDVGNESSSDEEEGRTSAVREKKKRKVVAKVSSTHQIDVPKTNTDGGIEGVDSTVGDIITSNTKKKKKKKGKKERAKDNNKDTSIEQQSLDKNTTDAQQSVAKEVASDKDANETTATTKDDSITNANATANVSSNTTTNTNTKRKRKKVRSRQKNIRKDNREVKPSHLIVGNEEYKGRPMTKETCEKLGIQSKMSDGRKKRRGNVDAMFDSGQWVGSEDKNDTNTNNDESAKEDTTGEDIKQPKEDVGDTLTRIGDCIVDNSSNIDNDDTTNKDDVGENILNEDRKKKKGKKHKKRKFKNLIVG